MKDKDKKPKADSIDRGKHRVNKRDLDKMLQLWEDGNSFYKIANKLGWKRDTVEKHVTAALAKRGQVSDMRDLAQIIELLTQVPEPYRPLILNTEEEQENLKDALLRGDSQSFGTYTVTCIRFPWWNVQGDLKIIPRLPERYKVVLDHLVILPKSRSLRTQLLDWERKASRYLELKRSEASAEKLSAVHVDLLEVTGNLHKEIWRVIQSLTWR